GTCGSTIGPRRPTSSIAIPRPRSTCLSNVCWGPPGNPDQENLPGYRAAGGPGGRPMLDLHCHILPGGDDGPASLAEALALARFAGRDGITHIAATPHCHRHLRLLRADILPHVTRFNVALAEASLPLTVLPGSEIQVTDTAAYRRDFDAGLYC